MNPVLVLAICCAVANKFYYVRAQPNIFEQGLSVLAGAVARGKEIIEHGVNVKSERSESFDFFGLKLGTNNGINTGFGDSATEKSLSSAEDDLVRKKRSLGLLRPIGILTNTAAGANINLVTINSVININNNYGSATEAKTIDETISYFTTKSELKFDGNLNGISVDETRGVRLNRLLLNRNPRNDHFIRNRRSLIQRSVMNPKSIEQMKKYSLEHKPGLSTFKQSVQKLDSYDNFETLTQAGESHFIRSKRSPQQTTTDVSVPEGSTERPRGGPRRDGPPPGPGRHGGPPGAHGKGKHHGGPCGCRGQDPPPPPGENDGGEVIEAELETMQNGTKQKREIAGSDSAGPNGTGFDSGRSYSSDSSGDDSEESASTEEYISSEMIEGDGASKKKQPRNKRSPCGKGGRMTSTAMPDDLQRTKRDVSPEEGAEKASSWFSSIIDVIVNSAKKLAEVTRKVFARDKPDQMEANPDAETI
ncbi:uncharacterized protein LOC131682036 isoform X2 [Topomyia yanbarensis]|uniref:uncharacterized protein LOC131682036 isoform X2 n=1 Tax=Topomyia yanbarensis TaxID=2498891 RepID=UPI00273BFB93|nr:uncharacterized protein LOC131682036 isoform X2 [Topomyia yanbarensis]